MNSVIIQAFKALEDIDDDAVVVRPKEKKPLKESMEDYYVIADGKNPRKSHVFTKIDNLDEFIANLEASKTSEYAELLHYVNGQPKKIWDSKGGRVQEACKIKEDSMVELHPEFDSRQSFYGKARVVVRDDGTQVLYSYGTPVCRIKDGKVTLLRKGYLGWSSSPTTLRHVKEFLKQNGFEAGSVKDLAKKYPVEYAGVNEDYDDLEVSWDSITRETIDKVKELTGVELSDRDIHFDDSRAWSFYVFGSKLGLPVQKFGAYRNYSGGGVRGPIAHNGREQDGKGFSELGEFFAQQLRRIEDLINAGYEDEEVWDKPTGVLTDESKEQQTENTQLNENDIVPLNDKKEVEDAKERLENQEDDSDLEEIVDVNADTVDKLKDSYLGDVVLICKKCRTPRFISPEDVEKAPDSDTYNIEDECPHCGANDGYELGGQIGDFHKEDESEEKTEVEIEKEVEVKTEEEPKEESEEEKGKKVTVISKEENKLAKAESFDDDKFNTLVTKYLKEVYENVDSFVTTDGTINENLEVTGTINYTDGKSKEVKFVFDNSNTRGNKVKFIGMNESLTNAKDAFTVIATIKDGVVLCESLAYNYTIKLNEEDTLVRGRKTLRESKKKEQK